nr:2-methoxy-6-polyprenyl-1,4-benzoquinol methylase, mitochondrial-like [Malus domestica]
MLEKVHPPRPDWCEEFYASVLNTSMKSYEDVVRDYKFKIAVYKAELFAELKGKAGKCWKLVLGLVGEAIPLDDASVDAVVGTLVLCSVKDVDNTLKDIRGVLRPGGRYLFVEHVAAKDGTILRFIHNVIDPLQQTLADWCRLTWKTRSKHNCDTLSKFKSGFSDVNLHMTTFSSASIIKPSSVWNSL